MSTVRVAENLQSDALLTDRLGQHDQLLISLAPPNADFQWRAFGNPKPNGDQTLELIVRDAFGQADCRVSSTNLDDAAHMQRTCSALRES